MSAANKGVLSLQDEDLTKILVAQAHLGSANLDFQMEQYIYSRRKADGVCLFNVRKMWDKLVLAARAIAAIENPADVCVISARQISQRGVLKYARYTGATPIAGRFTPGSFTNQIQRAFKEPRLVIITDPVADHQPITEASYVNIPVIAFVNSDNPLRHIDIAIPCNNRGAMSIGLMLWFLAREVLRLRGTLPRGDQWDVMCDLFFYRDQEEAAKEEAPAGQPGTEQHEPFDPSQGQTGEGEWDQGTTIGANVQLASGFAANEDWNPEGETNWNKGAPADTWTNPPAPQTSTWTAP